MSNSILVSYSGYPNTPSSLMPDNGLANLAGSLIAAGHKTTIMDYSTVGLIKRLFPYQHKDEIGLLVNSIIGDISKDKSPVPESLVRLRSLDKIIAEFQKEKVRGIAAEIAGYAAKSSIDFIGFKLWTGDGFEGSVIIAEELKRRNPDMHIFAGGPHVDWFGENILNITNAFDALVYGEGEESIVMLAEHAEGKRDLEDIPNLIFRKGNNIFRTGISRIKDLNALPSPYYDDAVYPAMSGNQKIKIAVLDESRGCNNCCYFCIQPVKSGGLRKKDAAKVADEIERMANEYGINSFKYAGSNTPKELSEGIAEEIIKRKIKVAYTSFAHVTAQRNYNLLKESGCYALFYGIESASQDMLDSMNKKIKIEQIKSSIQKTKAAGIKVVSSVIIPAPFETEETKRQTLELLLELRPDSVPVDPPALMPNTAWAKYPEKFNFKISPDFIKSMMGYKPKIFYPPFLWDPFPYSINGKESADIFRESSEFARLLEKQGITTQIADDILLMANYADMSPKEFRDTSRNYFLKGDHEAIGSMVKGINNRMKKI